MLLYALIVMLATPFVCFIYEPEKGGLGWPSGGTFNGHFLKG